MQAQTHSEGVQDVADRQYIVHARPPLPKMAMNWIPPRGKR